MTLIMRWFVLSLSLFIAFLAGYCQGNNTGYAQAMKYEPKCGGSYFSK